MKKNYIMITPCKNEEKYLPKLIDSVLKQKIKPKLWLIINDGSTDKSTEIIEKAAKKHKWIICDNLDQKKRDLRLRYSRICRDGFKKIIKICKNKNINWDYMVLLDADLVLPKDHFQKLLKKFDENRNLGIASGQLYYKEKGKLVQEPGPDYFPSGPVRTWRKNCFFETDMYKITYCPDSVSCMKARLNGWETKCYKDITGLHRRTSSANGLWKGYRISGEGSYYLNFHPIHIIGKSIYLTFKKPYFIGLAFLSGYFSKYMVRAPQLDDKQICNYYHNQRLKEKLKSILGIK